MQSSSDPLRICFVPTAASSVPWPQRGISRRTNPRHHPVGTFHTAPPLRRTHSAEFRTPDSIPGGPLPPFYPRTARCRGQSDGTVRLPRPPTPADPGEPQGEGCVSARPLRPCWGVEQGRRRRQSRLPGMAAVAKGWSAPVTTVANRPLRHVHPFHPNRRFHRPARCQRRGGRVHRQ